MWQKKKIKRKRNGMDERPWKKESEVMTKL
jgi:hypothetical protein